MAEKTYNTGRVVGWSTYEEFLKETGYDPNEITNYIYNTLVTYGVTRIVELVPGNWVESNGGQFYTQTVRVPGASWGAVPIVGVDYEHYLDVITDPTTTTQSTEEGDSIEKEDLEEAVGNIFGVYISDAQGKKAQSAVAGHGYLTFMAYPDILKFDEKMSRISGATMKLIVRGLSMEDLDVDTLYFGPQGFLFAGNGLIEDCFHETRNINNLSFNSAGYLWMSMGGNPDPADYRGLVDHPQGEILTSSFGYMNPDFINGTGEFANIGSYGFTYAELQDALSGAGMNVTMSQVNAIPANDRNDYLYLIDGEPSYTEYPDPAHPFFVVPVLKETGRVNCGKYGTWNTPTMKKLIDFTRLYGGNGDAGAVLYMYDKRVPDYLGSWWRADCPASKGLRYTGNNTFNGRWKDTDYSSMSGAVFTQRQNHERQACWKIPLEDNYFAKGYMYILKGNTNKVANGVYLCTKDKKHGDSVYQLNRLGGYINWTIPQWYKDKTGSFAFQVSLSGIPYSIQNGVLYVDGCPIYPGEIVVLGVPEEHRLVYVLNTVTSGSLNLICHTDQLKTLVFDDSYNSDITAVSDTYSNRIRITRAAWDARHAGRVYDVYSDASTHTSFTTTVPEVTPGSIYVVNHKKSSLFGYNEDYHYIVLDYGDSYVHLVSAMVWIKNPNLTATVGYPGLYDAIVPKYKNELPDEHGSYYYNMRTALGHLPAREFFNDFGWDIADYVDADFQNLSIGEFLREAVIRTDMSVPMSADTKRPVGFTSTFHLYSKQDLHYTSGPIPNGQIQCSIIMEAKTTTKSFFDTTWYTSKKASDGTVLNLNNDDFPIWATIAKSRHGEQTMSVSLIDDAGLQLDFTGNQGTIEADTITWLDLLSGLGTGKAVDILHGMKVRRTANDVNYLQTADGTTLVISKTEPSADDFPVGAIGIGW